MADVFSFTSADQRSGLDVCDVEGCLHFSFFDAPAQGLPRAGSLFLNEGAALDLLQAIHGWLIRKQQAAQAAALAEPSVAEALGNV